MFKFLKSEPEEQLYVYLVPQGEAGCNYEVINQDELEEKYRSGDLQEGCRLFKIEREIKVSFERVIHLD